jgi:hypothetical protein
MLVALEGNLGRWFCHGLDTMDIEAGFPGSPCCCLTGKNGMGQAFIAAAEERPATLGCVKVNLQVVASNSAVVAFYERAGHQIEPRVSVSKLPAIAERQGCVHVRNWRIATLRYNAEFDRDWLISDTIRVAR